MLCANSFQSCFATMYDNNILISGENFYTERLWRTSLGLCVLVQTPDRTHTSARARIKRTLAQILPVAWPIPPQQAGKFHAHPHKYTYTHTFVMHRIEGTKRTWRKCVLAKIKSYDKNKNNQISPLTSDSTQRSAVSSNLARRPWRCFPRKSTWPTKIWQTYGEEGVRDFLHLEHGSIKAWPT